MAITTTVEQIQLRQATTTAWAADNPILALGEEGYDVTAHKRKVGDGSTKWNDIAYYEDVITAAAVAAVSAGSTGNNAAGAAFAAVKAAGRTMTNTSTPTQDPDLAVAVAANRTYSLYARISYQGSAIKVGLTLPSGRIDGIARMGTIIAPVHIAGSAGVVANIGSFTGAAAEQVLEIRATVSIGAGAGTVAFTAAQDTASATATVVLAQSRLELVNSVAGTSASTAATSVDGTTGSGSTAPTTLANETFTGTTGSPWLANWRNAVGGDSTATIQAGAGQLLPPAVGYAPTREVLTGPGVVADSESYSEHKITGLTEHYVFASIRTQNTGGYNPNGYYVMLRPADPSGGFEVGVGNGANPSTLQQYGELTYVAGHTYGIRMNAVGSTIRFKVWDLAGAEPVPFQLTITDSTYASGYFGVSQQSGQTTNPPSLVDNVKVTTPPATTTGGATTADGSVAPVGPSGNWVRTFTDEFDGTSVDTTKWAKNWYGEGGQMNGVGTYAANATVSGSNLVLTLADATHGALIHTDITNGYKLPVGSYAEARISAPANASGQLYNWPAWWASTSNADGWPSAGEHDIFEVLSGQATVNYHSPSGSHNQGAPSGSWGNGFHTYGIHRKATSADVYWDGVLVKSYSTDDSGSPEILILNIGAQSPSLVGAGSKILVDYVRAWALIAPPA